jgi:hypothetical protein
MPALPQTIEDRLRRIEATIRELAGRANIRPALDQVIDGIVRIGSGGTLRVDRADGGQGLYAGDIYFPYEAGGAQRGLLVRDDQGELVLPGQLPSACPARTCSGCGFGTRTA